MLPVGDEIGDSKDNWTENVKRMGEESCTCAVLHLHLAGKMRPS